MSATISYKISAPKPHTHYFHVELLIENRIEPILDLSMAVWTPGSYMVREYAKNLEQLEAFDIEGNALIISTISKNSWQIETSSKTVVVRYRLYAFEETVRTCFLNEEHASIIPAALYIFPNKFEGPIHIQITPQNSWKRISTALEPVGNDIWQRVAPNKDILIDSPIEIGNHHIQKFEAAGVEHELAIYGEGNYDIDKIIADIIKIVEAEVSVFKHHPCKTDKEANNRYVFILQNTANGRGGLEHLFSTSLIFKRLGYVPESSYQEFISLVSHEYFHLWNVKRLRPAALGPFNYGEENYTTSLWIAEGFTNYYDDLILRRCNILTEARYLEIAEKNINDIENAAGKSIHPVAQASFDAWIKYYRQNENSINAQVNYYTKGGVLAMLLDMKIIANSKSEYSLDNVMEEAFQTFYLQSNRGYTEDEFKVILEKYAGEDLTDFYQNYVYGTGPIDYRTWFSYLGLIIENQETEDLEADLGMTVNDKNYITQIRKNSAAEKNKLNVQDEILAINNYRNTPSLLSTLTTDMAAGDYLICMVNRNGIIKTFEVALQISDRINYKISVDPDARPEQINAYKKWLHL